MHFECLNFYTHNNLVPSSHPYRSRYENFHIESDLISNLGHARRKMKRTVYALSAPHERKMQLYLHLFENTVSNEKITPIIVKDRWLQIILWLLHSPGKVLLVQRRNDLPSVKRCLIWYRGKLKIKKTVTGQDNFRGSWNSETVILFSDMDVNFVDATSISQQRKKNLGFRQFL